MGMEWLQPPLYWQYHLLEQRYSTDPSTYSIFRNGVTAANRMKMARNIANFIIQNNLDGVDIDWEYPGVRTPPKTPLTDCC